LAEPVGGGLKRFARRHNFHKISTENVWRRGLAAPSKVPERLSDGLRRWCKAPQISRLSDFDRLAVNPELFSCKKVIAVTFFFFACYTRFLKNSRLLAAF
jgi:hypothetical protein